MALGTIYIIAACLALPAAVLAFIFIVPEKKKEKMGKFGKLLHDIFNFKFLIIEKIFQFFYVLSTAFCFIGGFFMLFWVEHYYYGYYGGSSSEWMGYYGLLVMILGPIAVRIAYEGMMLMLIAIKNIIQINNKLKNQNEEGNNGDMFAIPSFSKAAPAPAAAPVAVAAPVAAPAPAASVCPNCGSPKSPDAFCVYCGQK